MNIKMFGLKDVVNFASASSSYHYTNIYSYWLNWLVLREVLNAACNIKSTAYKRVGGWDGRGGSGSGWVD